MATTKKPTKKATTSTVTKVTVKPPKITTPTVFRARFIVEAFYTQDDLIEDFTKEAVYEAAMLLKDDLSACVNNDSRDNVTFVELKPVQGYSGELVTDYE